MTNIQLLQRQRISYPAKKLKSKMPPNQTKQNKISVHEPIAASS